MKTFSHKYGTKAADIDPFADNLVVFYVYKSLAFFFNVYHDLFGPTPDINKILANTPKYEENVLLYNCVLIGSSLFLQFALIYVPLTFIVEVVYKKGSPLFRTVPSLCCLSACVLLSLCEILLDYQAILFVGLNLYAQYFLLTDEITSTLFMYGLSLNCSLDGLIFLPFIFYRVVLKALKQMYRDLGTQRDRADRPLEQLY